VPPGYKPPKTPRKPGIPNPIYIVVPGSPIVVSTTTPAKMQDGPITINVTGNEVQVSKQGWPIIHIPRNWITQPIDLRPLSPKPVAE
jgi:hypothetical protein